MHIPKIATTMPTEQRIPRSYTFLKAALALFDKPRKEMARVTYARYESR